MWAFAALAGWILLRDELQQALTLLLFPAWMYSELEFYAEGHIGMSAYAGRFLIVWALLYLTVFLSSKKAIVRWILFAVAAIYLIAGIVAALVGWRSWSGTETFLSFHFRVWAWLAIAALPLVIALFKRRDSAIPVLMAILFSLALPWCMRIHVEHNDFGNYHNTYTYSEPNLVAHALVAAFAVFVIWWGVRRASKALVNLGMIGFAIAVGWFYFSDIFDKVGRSLGLIGLGVLFLAGGWALEKMRRRLLARMHEDASLSASSLPDPSMKEAL
jgi:hypothetical protein